MQKQPQFLSLVFNSEKKFESWLRDLFFKKIEFEGGRTDLTTMWVHESGEILHCDFHARIYNGRFINIDELQVYKCLQVWNPTEQKWDLMGGLVVESIQDNLMKVKELMDFKNRSTDMASLAVSEQMICKESECKEKATVDYNGKGHWVCDKHYESLSKFFEEEYR